MISKCQLRAELQTSVIHTEVCAPHRVAFQKRACWVSLAFILLVYELLYNIYF